MIKLAFPEEGRTVSISATQTTQVTNMTYNLSDYFMTKTTNQLTRLIRDRLVKNETACNFIRDNDSWPLNEVTRIRTQLRKAHAIEEDCTEWLYDAAHYVSGELWNSIIEDLGWCYDGNCHSDRLSN